MEKLVFDYDVFEKGAGRIYQILIYCTLPALFLGVAMIAIINSGGMTHFGDFPDWVKMIFMLIVAIYVVPSLFILPTVWMLRSWKTSALKESYVLAGKRSVEYHKIVEKTVSGMKENVYVATQIKKVEDAGRKYILKGNIKEQATGIVSDELVIPKAYKNMDSIARAARYR